MTNDELDDGSLCINFDLLDDDDTLMNTGGYVLVSQEDNGFYIKAFDGQGNLVNEYVMEYKEAFNGDEEAVEEYNEKQAQKIDDASWRA